MSPRRLVIDLDVGIDDALAVLLFLRADKLGIVKIEAFVCTSGNTVLQNVCKNLVRLLEVSGRTDIPVYRGSHSPILPNRHKYNQFHGQDGFGDLEHQTEPDLSVIKPGIAASAIHGLVTSNPGEITLVCLGPLTNTALAMRMYPDFIENVKEVYLMGGNYSAMGNVTSTAEFNFHYDAEAAHIFFEMCKRPVVMVPWECCKRVNLFDWRWSVLTKAEGPLWKLIERAEKSVEEKQKTKRWSACDSYVAVVLLEPEVIKKSAQLHLSVEIAGTTTRGQVVVDHLKCNRPNAIVVQEIDEDVYKDVLLKACTEM